MGKMRGLTRGELKKFLSAGWVARIATAKEDGVPYIATVWYEFDGRDFYLGGRAKSTWAQHIKKNPNVALHIAKDSSPYTRALIEGKAEVVEGPSPIRGKWLKVANKMSVRYLGRRGPEYLVPTLDRPRLWIRITPTRVTTWEGVEWHRKYI